ARRKQQGGTGSARLVRIFVHAGSFGLLRTPNRKHCVRFGVEVTRAPTSSSFSSRNARGDRMETVHFGLRCQGIASESEANGLAEFERRLASASSEMCLAERASTDPPP